MIGMFRDGAFSDGMFSDGIFCTYVNRGSESPHKLKVQIEHF